jgi:hypothetical protein
MNRTLKRPMFRMGGSSGTGITSGLDRTGYAGNKPTFKQFLDGLNQEQKQMQQENLFKEYQNFLKRQQVAEQKTMAADGGRIGYQQGSMPSFQASGLPGFLTSFGLNLLATPPQGNIFQTAGIAAREPFNQLQTSQARARELQGERDFLTGETDRKIKAADERLEKELASREKIAGMKDEDVNVMTYAEIYKDTSGAPNMIKGKNAVDFFDTKYNELTGEYGVESVAVEPIDASVLQTQKALKLFRKQNPGAEGKVFFDVASGTAVKLAKDSETGDLALIPATGVVDTEGDDMPEPKIKNPGLFGQDTKPDVITPAVKEFLEDKDRPDFGIGFYDQ